MGVTVNITKRKLASEIKKYLINITFEKFNEELREDIRANIKNCLMWGGADDVRVFVTSWSNFLTITAHFDRKFLYFYIRE